MRVALALLASATIACGGSVRAPVGPGPAVPAGGLPLTTTRDAPLNASTLFSGSRRSILTISPMGPAPMHVSAYVPPQLPSYEGVWLGRTIRRHCAESGGAVGVACRVVPDHIRVQLDVTQTSSDVQGVLRLGGHRAAVTGHVRSNGTLQLRGSGGSGQYTLTVIDWRATLEGGRIRGTFSYVIAADDEGFGSVTVTAALDALTSRS